MLKLSLTLAIVSLYRASVPTSPFFPLHLDKGRSEPTEDLAQVHGSEFRGYPTNCTHMPKQGGGQYKGTGWSSSSSFSGWFSALPQHANTSNLRIALTHSVASTSH